MATLEQIQARLAEREREQAARLASAAKAHGRPQTQRTRELLRRLAYERHRRRALADPTCHPIRRARLELDGDGVTIEDLAARALVGASLIQKAERGQRVSAVTRKRLARALGIQPDDLSRPSTSTPNG
jgi:ribosome-binding protein aMBF1 (putative translation factor)